VCGFEYTSKLGRMCTDVVMCAELTAKFYEYLAARPDKQLPHTTTLSILQVSRSNNNNNNNFSWTVIIIISSSSSIVLPCL